MPDDHPFLKLSNTFHTARSKAARWPDEFVDEQLMGGVPAGLDIPEWAFGPDLGGTRWWYGIRTFQFDM